MATAYTPGLRITARTTIEKIRRLPLKGQVLVNVGDWVEPETVVARTELPGTIQTLRVAETLGIEPSDVPAHLKVKVGDKVQSGTLIAEAKSFFGLLKHECKSPVDGTVEIISPVSGHVGIRRLPTPVEVKAYVSGRVKEIVPEEGVVVETMGALIQGIFGIGGERLGEIAVPVNQPDQPLRPNDITEHLAGKVIVGGSNINIETLRQAVAVGVVGIVVGGILDQTLIDYLGHDIGVAITGQEMVPATLIVTEGFGTIRMAQRTFDLLKSLEGKKASINGATQVRAGVIRPEIIVPAEESKPSEIEQPLAQVLDVGANVRGIREPYFGLLGTVTALPPALALIESGAMVRVLEVQFENGQSAVIPRANVEIIEG